MLDILINDQNENSNGGTDGIIGDILECAEYCGGDPGAGATFWWRWTYP